MSFTKEYFDLFENDLMAYCKRVKTDAATVTLKIIYGGEYKVATIVSGSDQLLSFAYYGSGERKSTPLPMLTVPYSGIAWVDMRPSKGKEKMGFQSSLQAAPRQ